MARIKISLPQNLGYSTLIPVRITDLNYGGHVGNDTVLSLIHEARMRFLQHYGYTELHLDNASLIMGDVAIEFKSELFYGDTVKASIGAGDFSRVGFDLYYRLVKEGTETVVAVAKTGMICFDYGKRKVVALPESVKQVLENIQD